MDGYMLVRVGAREYGVDLRIISADGSEQALHFYRPIQSDNNEWYMVDGSDDPSAEMSAALESAVACWLTVTGAI